MKKFLLVMVMVLGLSFNIYAQGCSAKASRQYIMKTYNIKANEFGPSMELFPADLEQAKVTVKHMECLGYGVFTAMQIGNTIDIIFITK